MKRQHRSILLAFIIWANLKTSFSLPVPEDELDTSTRLLGSSVVTSVSVVTGSGKDEGSSFQSRKVEKMVPKLPVSPAGLLRPDKFQFYTLNKHGEVVTKQMTEKEIQSLIAAGGGHLPIEIHETQMAGEVPTAGMKVADVVQNVQNVLKSELSKPTTVMTSVPTIPGHANAEWSSILPSILAGDMENQALNIPESEMITNVENKIPNSEPEVKPEILEVKPLFEASSGSKLKPNASSVSLVKSPDSKPTATQGKPVLTDKPQDSTSSETHYEPINIYSTLKSSTSSEKLSFKPNRPSSSDSYSKVPTFSSSEKPTVFQKPSKPQISVRPNPEIYEEIPHASVGIDKYSKPSTPAYILLSEKQTQAPSKTTVTKKPFETSKKPSYSFRPEYPPVSYSEIPMIPVHVITADQILTSTPQYHNDNFPIFQVLNTISADAIGESNSTKIGVQETQAPEKFTSEKPNTPSSEIVFTEASLSTKLPEMVTNSNKIDLPNMVSVVSETHSTSIKIPGLPEIPFTTSISNKPTTTPKPKTQTTISIQSSIKDKTKGSSGHKHSADESQTSSIHPVQNEATTQKIFESEVTTTDLITEITTEISENSSPNISEELETTTDYASYTSTIPVTEEIQFQKMPDLAIVGQMISPETSAIEKIIETLHHPTESKFATSTIIDMDTDVTEFSKKSEISTTFTILGEETSTPDSTTFASSPITETKPETTEGIILSSGTKIKTSTAPTFFNLENSTNGTLKPYEPLPTELADSLSSMISQISETIPSFLPVSQSSLLTEVPLKQANKYNSTNQQNTESTRVTQGLPYFETTMYKNAEVDIGATVRLEDSTETLKNVESSSTSKPEIETSKTNISKTENESVKADLVSSRPVNSSFFSTISSPTVTPSTTSSIPTSSSTDSSSIVSPSKASPITVETTERLQSSSEAVNHTSQHDESAQDQTPQSNESQKIFSAKMTEKPIIRVAVTESGTTNLPQIHNKGTGSTESAVIRIQVSDAVSKINNLLETAPAQPTASYVTLNLPEGQNSSPNNIGSGLVAGFSSGNEIAFGSEKQPILIELLTYSDTSSNSETKLKPSKGAGNKTKDAEAKIEGVDDHIKDEKIHDNKDGVITEDIIDHSGDKIKSTEEKTKSSDQDKMKVKKETETSENRIKNSTTLEKEPTTEKDLLISTTNVDKIEITTKAVGETQTETSLGISFQSIETENQKNSTSSSPIPEVNIDEKIRTTSEVSTNLKNNTSSFLQENQIKASSSDQSTTESSTTLKMNIIEVKNITDKPILMSTSLNTEINKTETSTSEKMETIITTTPTSNTKANITTPKSNVETVVTTSEPKITSLKPTVVPQSTNKTRKPETPVVRIDISPEISHSELPQKVHLTDLPIVDTPVRETINVPVNNDKLSLNDTKPIHSESNTLEKPESNKNGSLSNDNKQKKVDAISDINFDLSMQNISFVEGQEVRIRVNDTAVLVSKIPSPIIKNETKTISLDKEVNVNKMPSVSIKEEHVKKTEDKIDMIPSEVLKNPLNSSKDEQNKSDIRTTLNQKDEPSMNLTKVTIVNTTQPLDSYNIRKNNVSSGSKPNIYKPVTHAPSLDKKENTDHTKENAYHKLGEFESTSIENNKNTPHSFQKKNVTLTSTKPGSSGHKPIKASKPTVSSGTKPGGSSTKPNLPSKNRPSSYETISYKPIESNKIKKPDSNLNTEEKWALIPQQSTSSSTNIPRPSASNVNTGTKEVPRPQAQRPQVALDASQSAIGLDGSIMNLDPDIISFSDLCNELAFSFWSAANKGLSNSRSLVLSPFGMISMLAMVFLGARGPTSNEMNDVLKLDDVATFNPHLVFQNVTDKVSLSRKQGIANAAFVRELFADKSKVGKLMPFYKEQAQQFYEGYVEEVNFAAISDIVRRTTNHLVRKQTGGRIRDFVRTNTVGLKPPLAALSANVFQTECNSSTASSEGRDGELYFAVSPAIRQRKLIPIPAIVWKSGVLAGYEPSLDATAIALGGMEKLVSTIFVVPGQQGHMAPGDNLDNLEMRLVRGAQHDKSWQKLLKVLIPRTSLELQMPKFSHRSIVNATSALKNMGLAELFTKHADLKGINGVGHDLHLADVLQMNLFSTCGDENISTGRHHVEIYPGPPVRNFRKMSDEDKSSEALPDEDFHPESEKSSSIFSGLEENSTDQEFTSRSSRQSEISEKPRLKLDRPFLYFVRHNPTGLLLHMGRFNPRLLP